MAHFRNGISFPVAVIQEAARVSAYDAIRARSQASVARKMRAAGVRVAPDATTVKRLQVEAESTGAVAAALAKAAQEVRDDIQ